MATFKTDLEIAQEARLRPIGEIAAKLGIIPDHLEQYGKYKAKLSPEATVGKAAERQADSCYGRSTPPPQARAKQP